MILLPIVMDPFGQLGPVIRRLLYKKHKQIPGYHNIETSNAEELQMQTAVRKHAPMAYWIGITGCGDTQRTIFWGFICRGNTTVMGKELHGVQHSENFNKACNTTNAAGRKGNTRDTAD